jgi:hypothetical protein
VCLIGWDEGTAIAITMTGKRTWSHPALPVWVGGRGIVIGKWLLENGGIGNGYWIIENWFFENGLLVIGHCNRALAGITFFPIGNLKYL